MKSQGFLKVCAKNWGAKTKYVYFDYTASGVNQDVNEWCGCVPINPYLQ